MWSRLWDHVVSTLSTRRPTLPSQTQSHCATHSSHDCPLVSCTPPPDHHQSPHCVLSSLYASNCSLLSYSSRFYNNRLSPPSHTMTTLPVSHPLYGRGTSTSIVAKGMRKTHSTFLQGTEMVAPQPHSPSHFVSSPHPPSPLLPPPFHLQIEEFDATSELLKSQPPYASTSALFAPPPQLTSLALAVLSARRVRHKSELGAQGAWKWEVGDPIQVHRSSAPPHLLRLSFLFSLLL